MLEENAVGEILLGYENRRKRYRIYDQECNVIISRSVKLIEKYFKEETPIINIQHKKHEIINELEEKHS